MSDKTLVLIIILVFVLILKQNIDCVFVSVGDYPDYRKYGINLRECGLGNGMIKVYNISYSVNCFGEGYDMLWSISRSLQNENNVRQRIAFGEDAEFGEAPFTVYSQFVHGASLGGSCTGILITFNWVLTAAHCLTDKEDYVEVRAGSNLKTGIERRIGYPNNWFTHPDYSYIEFNGTHNITKYRPENDIGLIKLNKTFTIFSFDKHYLINTICLPNASDKNTENDLATYFGFGRIRDNLRAARLQKGVSNLLPFGKCPANGTVFCTNTVGSVTKLCEGDSGGPLLQYLNEGLRAVLVGVNRSASPKSGTCESRTISYWNSVPFHLNWILRIIVDNNSND